MKQAKKTVAILFFVLSLLGSFIPALADQDPSLSINIIDTEVHAHLGETVDITVNYTCIDENGCNDIYHGYIFPDKLKPVNIKKRSKLDEYDDEITLEKPKKVGLTLPKVEKPEKNVDDYIWETKEKVKLNMNESEIVTYQLEGLYFGNHSVEVFAYASPAAQGGVDVIIDPITFYWNGTLYLEYGATNATSQTVDDNSTVYYYIPESNYTSGTNVSITGTGSGCENCGSCTLGYNLTIPSSFITLSDTVKGIAFLNSSYIDNSTCEPTTMKLTDSSNNNLEAGFSLWDATSTSHLEYEISASNTTDTLAVLYCGCPTGNLTKISDFFTDYDAFFQLNETSGSNAVDTITGNALTDTNTVGVSTINTWKVRRFDGSDKFYDATHDYLQLTGDIDGPGFITFAFANTDGSTRQVFFGSTTGTGSNIKFYIQSSFRNTNDNSLEIQIRNDAAGSEEQYTDSNATWFDAGAHLVWITWDSLSDNSTYTMRVDGIEYALNPYLTNLAGSDMTFTMSMIGCSRYSGSDSNFQVNNAKIWRLGTGTTVPSDTFIEADWHAFKQELPQTYGAEMEPTGTNVTIEDTSGNVWCEFDQVTTSTSYCELSSGNLTEGQHSFNVTSATNAQFTISSDIKFGGSVEVTPNKISDDPARYNFNMTFGAGHLANDWNITTAKTVINREVHEYDGSNNFIKNHTEETDWDWTANEGSWKSITQTNMTLPTKLDFYFTAPENLTVTIDEINASALTFCTTDTACSGISDVCDRCQGNFSSGTNWSYFKKDTSEIDLTTASKYLNTGQVFNVTATIEYNGTGAYPANVVMTSTFNSTGYNSSNEADGTKVWSDQPGSSTAAETQTITIGAYFPVNASYGTQTDTISIRYIESNSSRCYLTATGIESYDYELNQNVTCDGYLYDNQGNAMQTNCVVRAIFTNDGNDNQRVTSCTDSSLGVDGAWSCSFSTTSVAISGRYLVVSICSDENLVAIEDENQMVWTGGTSPDIGGSGGGGGGGDYLSVEDVISEVEQKLENFELGIEGTMSFFVWDAPYHYTIQKEIENTGGKKETIHYDFKGEITPWIEIEPSIMTLGPGEKGIITITITNTENNLFENKDELKYRQGTLWIENDNQELIQVNVILYSWKYLVGGVGAVLLGAATIV